MTFQKGHKVNLGRFKTEETRQKIRLSKIGTKWGHHTEETKRKISLAQKGRKGRPQTEEIRRKISLGLMGRPVSQETRDKISKANKGEKHGGWKDENATYSGKHSWILRNYGNPPFCEDCGLVGRKVGRTWNIDWSNCDNLYRRKIEDYNGRCRSCHMKYDNKSIVK